MTDLKLAAQKALEAMERLGSMEAFHMSRAVSTVNDAELLARIVYAREQASTLRSALQHQEEREPVAWRITRDKKVYGIDLREAFGEFYAGTKETADEYLAKGWKVVPLYATPLLLQKEEGEPPRFPTMLRKMWSGGEVQAWIDEHWTKGEKP